MALNIDYANRSITWGNQALTTARFDSSGKIDSSSIGIITGMISASNMEDQSEVQNFAADDVPNHGSKKGSTLLQGEMTFYQADDTLKTELLGQVKATNELGYVETGQYPFVCVQYIQRTQTKKADGTIEQGYKVIVYPNVQATGELQFESETDSTDGVDPIQYTLAIQATATDNYQDKGHRPARQIFDIQGDDVALFEKKFSDKPFIFMPDTTLTATTE